MRRGIFMISDYVVMRLVKGCMLHAVKGYSVIERDIWHVLEVGEQLSSHALDIVKYRVRQNDLTHL